MLTHINYYKQLRLKNGQPVIMTKFTSHNKRTGKPQSNITIYPQNISRDHELIRQYGSRIYNLLCFHWNKFQNLYLFYLYPILLH